MTRGRLHEREDDEALVAGRTHLRFSRTRASVSGVFLYLHRGLLLNQQHRSGIHVSNCSTVSLLSDRSILKRLAGGTGGLHVNTSGITEGGRVFARGLQFLDGGRRLEGA